MKLIINIPDNEYRHIKEYYEKNDIVEATYSYIYHGTPLPDDAIIIDAKEQSDYVFIEKAKYNDLIEAASKALTDRIKKSLHEGVIAESEVESEDKE